MAKVLFPNGEVQNLVGTGPNGRVTLLQAQQLVGGDVDVIELVDNDVLIIADDFTGSDYNVIASLITSAITRQKVVICGIAIRVDTRFEGWGRSHKAA